MRLTIFVVLLSIVAFAADKVLHLPAVFA